MKIKCVAFDCFGTLFDMSHIPAHEIKAYVEHVKREDFSPFTFPESWFKLKTHPDVKYGMQLIRELGIKCVTLSNGSALLTKTVLINNGIVMDHVVDLVAHRAYKPNNLDAYRAVEKDTGFKPEETLMVTANETFGDIESSAKIGMRSKLIRVPYCVSVISLFDYIKVKNDY